MFLKPTGNREAIKRVISGGHYNKYHTPAWAENLSSIDSSFSCESLRRDHLACSWRLLCQQHISMNELDFFIFFSILFFQFNSSYSLILAVLYPVLSYISCKLEVKDNRTAIPRSPRSTKLQSVLSGCWTQHENSWI